MIQTDVIQELRFKTDLFCVTAAFVTLFLPLKESSEMFILMEEQNVIITQSVAL